MRDPSARPPAPPRARLTPASLASVVVSALVGLTWGVASVALLVGGISALPALGSGLLLLIPWLGMMQLAVRAERRRVPDQRRRDHQRAEHHQPRPGGEHPRDSDDEARAVDDRGLDAFLAKAKDAELSARALKIKKEIAGAGDSAANLA